MSTRIFTLGNTITFSTSFVDRATHMPRNPTAVLFRVLDPNGTETRPGVTNPEVGMFVASFVPNIPGKWQTRWEGSGVVEYAVEGEFQVRTSAFT